MQLVLPQANVSFANERLSESPDIKLIGIKEHEPITIGDFTINGIAAAHNEVERDANGNLISWALLLVLAIGTFIIQVILYGILN